MDSGGNLDKTGEGGKSRKPSQDLTCSHPGSDRMHDNEQAGETSTVCRTNNVELEEESQRGHRTIASGGRSSMRGGRRDGLDHLTHDSIVSAATSDQQDSYYSQGGAGSSFQGFSVHRGGGKKGERTGQENDRPSVREECSKSKVADGRSRLSPSQLQMTTSELEFVELPWS